MNTSSSRNSSAKIGTPVTFTCTSCYQTRTARPHTYWRVDGRAFLVCKSCFHRIEYLIDHIPAAYTQAMAFLASLRGDL